jgi:hypothetical protein
MAGMTLPAPPAAGGLRLGGLPEPLVDSVPQKTPPAGVLSPVGVNAPSEPDPDGEATFQAGGKNETVCPRPKGELLPEP